MHVIMILVTVQRCKDGSVEFYGQTRQAVASGVDAVAFDPIFRVHNVGDTTYIGFMWSHPCERITNALLGD